MKWFNRSNDEEEDYPLEAEQSAKSRARGVKWLLYLSLLAVVLTTAAHAILLVMSSTDSFTLAAENGGLFYMILAVLRVGWPVIIEIVAVGVGVGFLVGLWRGGPEGCHRRRSGRHPPRRLRRTRRDQDALRADRAPCGTCQRL